MSEPRYGSKCCCTKAPGDACPACGIPDAYPEPPVCHCDSCTRARGLIRTQTDAG